MRRTLTAFIGVAVMVAAIRALAGEPPRAVYSAGALRARLAESHEKIRSIEVVYESVPGFYKAPRFPPGTYLHRHVAATADGRLYHVKAHGHAAMSWEDDPLQQRCYVAPDHWYVTNPVNRTYFCGILSHSGPLPGTMPDEFFFIATGIWPFDERPAPCVDEESHMLRDIAVSDDYSVVRPQQEMIDGHWCHVLERPGLDTLWIDSNRDYALLARERRKTKAGPLMSRYELSGHDEVAPAVWLPRKIRNIQFDYLATTEEGRSRRVIDATFTVLRAEANCVDERLFRCELPPGALDIGAEIPRQTVPGGLDHLDHLVDWMQRNVPKHEIRSLGRHWAESAVWGLSLVGLLCLSCREVWRMRRARRGPCP